LDPNYSSWLLSSFQGATCRRDVPRRAVRTGAQGAASGARCQALFFACASAGAVLALDPA
jgi:hypothetical protein